MVDCNSTYDLNTSATASNSKNYKSDNIELYNLRSGKEIRTTVMARNISIQYFLPEILKELNKKYRNKYDYLNCPPGMSSARESAGYFIINFIHPSFVIDFHNDFMENKILCGIGKKINYRSWREVKFARFQRKQISKTDSGLKNSALLFRKDDSIPSASKLYDSIEKFDEMV